MTALPPITHHSAHVNGVRIRYARGGEGPPLVLLHGFPQSSRTWRHVMPAFLADYTVMPRTCAASAIPNGPRRGTTNGRRREKNRSASIGSIAGKLKLRFSYRFLQFFRN